MSNKPKILFIDIETRPTLAYVWRLWKENIGVEQIVEPSSVICFGAKWFRDKSMWFYSDWQHGHENMIEAAHRLLSEADAVVTYNGDRFDLPKLAGEFAVHGLMAPPPPTSIDVIKTVRKLGLVSNKLAFVGPMLQVGSKIKNEGFGLWIKVINDDVSAQKRMEKYCIQDVRLLENLYKKLRPFIRNHPYMGESNPESCSTCGSSAIHKRGFRRTKAFRIQRLQCQRCGGWSDGKRTKMN